MLFTRLLPAYVEWRSSNVYTDDQGACLQALSLKHFVQGGRFVECPPLVLHPGAHLHGDNYESQARALGKQLRQAQGATYASER